MKNYVFKFTIQEKIVTYYTVESDNIFTAKKKVQEYFEQQYPGADWSVIEITTDKETERIVKNALNIIEGK